MKSYRLYICAAITVLVVASIPFAYKMLARHSDPPEQTPLKADAGSLKGTIVTPHLQQKIIPGKNILWCATFQLAWNELRDMAKGPVTLVPYAPDTKILNNSKMSKSDIDSSAYIAKAGFIEDGIVQQIQNELEQKFHGHIHSDFLKDGSQREGIVAYANLYKSLPFWHPFDRANDTGLAFLGEPVQSFGIPEKDVKTLEYAPMVDQVIIIDENNKDDFIIELETKDYTNQLILAKVPPLSTLEETIKMVQARYVKCTHEENVKMLGLHIPVIDFDILKHYDTLTKHTIRALDKRVNGQVLGIAEQSVQFCLDERGAKIKSEFMGGVGMRGMGKTRYIDLLFDKPFLILIKRKDSKYPYFALWVSNSELFFPVK